MNVIAIYERMPVFLQNLVVAYHGRKLHKMRFGGVHDEQRREILACETMTEKQIRSYQVDKLRKVLCEAAENVPYYQSRATELRELARGMTDPSALTVLPLLEKATINEDSSRFHSLKPRGKRIYGNTSGTTGRPLRTLKVPESYQRNWAFYARSKEIHGVRLGMRRVTFGARMVVPPGQTEPPFWRVEPAENNLFCSLYHLSDANLPHYWEAIHRWKPEEIVCYPSGASVVADWMNRSGHALTGVRAVFIMSETLFDWQRATMERAFGAKVVNLYGLAENVAWIAECPEGRLHVRPDYGYTELLPVEGAEPPADHPQATVCEIVSTGFLNMAMPLLRYRTRDQAIVTAEDVTPCACGLRNFPTVTRIIGRVDENLMTADGRVHTRLDGVLKGIPGVVESQIEQTALDRLLVRVVPKEDYGTAATDEITLRLRRLFGADCRVDFERVDALPRTKAGKVRYQVNSLPEAERARFAGGGRAAAAGE